MNAKSDDVREPSPRSASRGEAAGARKRVGQRKLHFLVAPGGPRHGELTERINAIGGVEIVRILAARGLNAPPVAVVRASDEKALAIRRSAGGSLMVEADEPLRAASLAACAPLRPASMTNAAAAGFATTIQVTNESDEPLADAQVQLVGQQWAAQGVTGPDGRITLTLHGELPDTVTDLIVDPRAGHWGLWRSQPKLQADAVNTVALRSLSEAKEPGWAASTMRFDQLPTECRGRGTKVALIDTGIATSHQGLRGIARGFATSGADGTSWSQDEAGHGTLCAGIIAAAPAASSGIAGYASEADLYSVKLAADARCSDLIAAIDGCAEAGVDIACLGFVCGRGSAIVEQRIAAAKQRGMAIIAAAGNSGGRVEFPACSRHVLAVGALERSGTFPDDSPQAMHAETAAGIDLGLKVPAFSCRGPELDVCAPGVAIMSCQSPDGFAVRDGTSLAAAHVAALAALMLAHHSDFQAGFAARDGRRVERLFQILKATAQPLGDPLRTGAGLPDAVRALGLQPHLREAQSRAPQAGLEDLRHAMRLAGLGGPGGSDWRAEPLRGPAAVTNMPLNIVPPPGLRGVTTDAALRDLSSAMVLAGIFAA